jgi:hypothetical protein
MKLSTSEAVKVRCRQLLFGTHFLAFTVVVSANKV